MTGFLGCGEELRITDELKTAIEGLEAEFDVGRKRNRPAEWIGAEYGLHLIVNGQEIELYKYDPAAENAIRARENGKVKKNELALPAVYNEQLNMVLIWHDVHSDGEKIKSVFENLGSGGAITNCC